MYYLYVSLPRVVFRVTIGAIYKRNLYDSRYAFVGLTQFFFKFPVLISLNVSFKIRFVKSSVLSRRPRSQLAFKNIYDELS